MVEPGVVRARHWVYLDDARTHEVHAQVEPRPTDIHLATTEFPAGSRDPTEALTEERSLSSAQQLDAAIRDLEERLAVSGQYYRADVEDMRWSALRSPAGARRIDLRAHEVALPGATTPAAKLAFHHFHSSGRDALLISLPRTDLETPRSILAQLDFDFPHVDRGEMRVLHTRLAPSTLRSAVVKQHFELPTQGYAKLVESRDYEGAYGPGWLERTRDVFRRAAQRAFTLDTLPRAAPTRPNASDHPPVEQTQLAAALRTPKVSQLRYRYLTPSEAEDLLQRGELSIRRFVQTKRKRADHHTMFDLSLLESILLVEYGMRVGQQDILREQGAKLLRFTAPRVQN